MTGNSVIESIRSLEDVGTLRRQIEGKDRGASAGLSRQRRRRVLASAPQPSEDRACELHVTDYRDFLDSLDPGSVDLLLTDPPYAISRKTGFQNCGENGVERFALSMDFGKWDHKEIDLPVLAEKAFRVIRGGGGGDCLLRYLEDYSARQCLTRCGIRSTKIY